MLRVSERFGFNRTAQSAGLTNVLNQSLTTASTGWTTTTIRQFIDQSAFPGAPTLVRFIRCTLIIQTAGINLPALYVGAASAPNLAGIGSNLNARFLVPLKVNGNVLITAPGSGVMITDPVEFLWDKTTPLIFSWYMPGTQNLCNATGLALPANFYWRSDGDYSNNLDVSAGLGGWSPTAQPVHPLMLISGIDLGAG